MSTENKDLCVEHKKRSARIIIHKMIYRPHNDLVACFDCAFHTIVVTRPSSIQTFSHSIRTNSRKEKRDSSNLQSCEPVNTRSNGAPFTDCHGQQKCACCQKFILIIRYNFYFPVDKHQSCSLLFICSAFCAAAFLFAAPNLFNEFLIVE